MKRHEYQSHLFAATNLPDTCLWCGEQLGHHYGGLGYNGQGNFCSQLHGYLFAQAAVAAGFRFNPVPPPPPPAYPICPGCQRPLSWTNSTTVLTLVDGTEHREGGIWQCNHEDCLTNKQGDRFAWKNRINQRDLIRVVKDLWQAINARLNQKGGKS